MPVAQSAEFKKAVEDSRKLKAKPTNDELLQMYGLFKQGSQDPPFEKTTAPGMFEMKVRTWQSYYQSLVRRNREDRRRPCIWGIGWKA